MRTYVQDQQNLDFEQLIGFLQKAPGDVDAETQRPTHRHRHGYGHRRRHRHMTFSTILAVLCLFIVGVL